MLFVVIIRLIMSIYISITTSIMISISKLSISVSVMFTLHAIFQTSSLNCDFCNSWDKDKGSLKWCSE